MRKEKPIIKEDHLQDPPPDQVSINVDKLLAIEAELTLFDGRRLLKDYDAVKALLASTAADEAYVADRPVVLNGTTGQVQFSPKVDVVEITDLNTVIGKLKAKIGYPALLELLKIGITDLKRFLTPVEIAELTVTKPGSRRIASVTYFNPIPSRSTR
jgi:hypothetical protein